MGFRYIYPADEYKWDEDKEEYVNMTEEDLGLRTLYNNGLEVKMALSVRTRTPCPA